MLKKFSADAHPHLVSLLATYEQHRKFYLIFHWAEADLQDYWENQNHSPKIDHDTILWMAQQCEGISGGLSKIHRYESNSNPRPILMPREEGTLNLPVVGSQAQPQGMTRLYGRHGDIKPANILWFRDPNDPNGKGVLKITDFGLAEFSAAHSRSYKPKSKVANTANYRPPECDLLGELIGPSYDIWTLGCVYLEFVTWLLGGWKLVEEFTRNRLSFDRALLMDSDTFFEIEEGSGKAKIKSSVTEVSCIP